MIKFLKRLFAGKKQYIYGYDAGEADMTAFAEGYIDKKGVYHITEITHTEKDQ